MSDYREIRLRLNLRRQRDRWLSSALDEAVEELGAPIASIVRRSLSAYLGGRDAGRDSGAGAAHPPSGTTAPRHVRGGRAGSAASEARRPSPERAHESGGDPWLQDERGGDADIAGMLASIGTPPDPPDGR